jgi:signal transduction histidine kinase
MRSQGFRRLLDDVLQSGEPYVGKEVPAEFGVEGQRRTIYFNFVYSPLRDLHGQVDGILIIAFDVTDEIRAREELARTIHYNQMFTGILGHDLRNPLGAISATAEIMTMVHADDDRIAEPAQRILSSSRRMTRMIEQLLDLTRIRLAGGLAIERKHVDLSAILSAVLGEIERGVPEWKVQLKITGDARGHWDPDRLAQVLSNLLGNAAAHGAREVPTRIYVDGRDAFQLSATFANKGTIPPDLLPHLFEPFRGTAHARLNSRGLGLGLYIAKEIIGAHGGHIQVTSSEEAGTEFRVVLPRR